MKILKEFRDFAIRGNVIDLAVAVIIGGAFGLIVSSLVNDVLMPPLGWLAGGVDFKDKVLIIQHKGELHSLTQRELPADVVVSYGRFINSVINFIIVGIAIFMAVKVVNQLRRKQAAEPDPAPPPPTREDSCWLKSGICLRGAADEKSSAL